MKKKKNKGFSIIELVVSIAIVTILFAGIMVGLYLGIHTVTISRHRSEAIVIAQHDMEGIKGNGYVSITPHGYAANGILGETEVSVDDVNEEGTVIGKEVTVSVRWMDFGNTYTESVSSFIRDPSF